MKLKRFAAVLILLMVSSAAYAAGQRVIYYYDGGCGDPEIVSDLDYSISNIGDFAKKHGIQLVQKDDKKKCGYVLSDGKKSKYQYGAMTDVDLVALAQQFFHIKPESSK